MSKLYDLLVRDGAIQTESDGQVDLVLLSEAASAGFDTSTFLSDVNALVDQRQKESS